MVEQWDTIIVGAGVGGLTAAAELVKAGLRVLVLDRNPHPGGTAYVYKRKGFAFPMGPLGFSNQALVADKLKDIGDHAEFKLDRIHYQIKAFDLNIPISLPFPEMIELLSSLFPFDDQGIQQFFQAVESIPPVSFKASFNQFVPKPADMIPASDYLDHLVKDWRLRRILGSLGTGKAHSNLSLLAAMWILMCKEGIWNPVGSTKSLCDRLAERITGISSSTGTSGRTSGMRSRQKGLGEIRLDQEVSEIRVRRGGVLGVRLRDGMEINSVAVISNADYKTTFNNLVNKKEVPDQLYQAVQRAKQTGSVFQVCLGVDVDKVDLALFKKAQIIIYKRNQKKSEQDLPVDWTVPFIDPEIFAQQELEISLWNQDNRSLVPERGASIVIRTGAEHDHFLRFRPAWNKRSSDYFQYKMQLGRSLLREAEKLLPGLEQSTVVMDMATPLTFEEQGGRSKGSVAGWSWDYGDDRDLRPRELVRTPIKGLYMAGYQAFSQLFMGGVPSALESGKRAAEAVLENAGPIVEILIPGR